MDDIEAFTSEWAAFCDDLRGALIQSGGDIINSSTNVLDRDEGLRMLLRQLRHSLERDLEERDVTHPTFGPVATDTYHTLADAPDYAAYDALISGQHMYRLKGRFGEADSLNFTTMAPRPLGDEDAMLSADWKPWPGAGASDEQSAGRIITGTLELSDLEPDDSGRFEVLLSVERPSGGVWLPMSKESNRLVVRNVYKGAYSDHRRRNPAQLWLECVGASSSPAVYSTDDLRAGLRSVLNGVVQIPGSRRPIFQRIRASANMTFANDDAFWKRSGANPRTQFQEAYWHCGADEAVVIELDETPRCSSWSVGLTNAWMESLDFRFFAVNVNSESATYEPDGSLRIIIAHADPGHPNWLDVAGHRHGAMLWRWNDLDSVPAPTRIRATRLASVVGSRE